MSNLKKSYYMREHSNIVRKYSAHRDSMADDPPAKISSDIRQAVLVIMCRKKQRLLQQALEQWTRATNVVHDYTIDLRIILARQRNVTESLDELEIEVLYKWMIQNYASDPTGIANLLKSCRKKEAVVQALQDLRLEQFAPGDGILFQNTFPRAEDGLFTVLSGECDVLQFAEGSLSLIEMGRAVKEKNWEGASTMLNDARLINTMRAPTGFGELASLALIKRTASVRARVDQDILTELLIISRKSLFALLSASSRFGEEMHNHSEAIDFLRQSGLGVSVSSRELFSIAASMRKRVVTRGSLLYRKHDLALCVYVVVSGEIIVDTEYEPPELLSNRGAKETGAEFPFLSSLPENCYILSNGSLLGDEAFAGGGAETLSGVELASSASVRYYESSAAVISEMAVLFEVTGVGLQFLIDRLNGGRYSALAYRDLSPFGGGLVPQADANSIHTIFNSLRRCIAEANPQRGCKKWSESIVERGKTKHAHTVMTANREQEKGRGGSASLAEASEARSNLHTAATAQRNAAGASARHASSTIHMLSLSHEESGWTQLPLTVIQHALKIKRSHKKEETLRMRELAKNSILHEELKKHTTGGHGAADQPSSNPQKIAKLKKTEMQLSRSLGAYKTRLTQSRLQVSPCVTTNGPDETVSVERRIAVWTERPTTDTWRCTALTSIWRRERTTTPLSRRRDRRPPRDLPTIQIVRIAFLCSPSSHLSIANNTRLQRNILQVLLSLPSHALTLTTAHSTTR